jgi:hypothetical protein
MEQQELGRCSRFGLWMSKLRCHLSVGLEPDCGEYFAELTKFGVSAVFTVVFLSPPSSVL